MRTGRNHHDGRDEAEAMREQWGEKSRTIPIIQLEETKETCYKSSVDSYEDKGMTCRQWDWRYDEGRDGTRWKVKKVDAGKFRMSGTLASMELA
jgi:hypothetical protein